MKAKWHGVNWVTIKFPAEWKLSAACYADTQASRTITSMSVDVANNRLYIGITPQTPYSFQGPDKVKFVCDFVTSGSTPGETGTYDIHTFSKLNTVPDETIFSDLAAHGY